MKKNLMGRWSAIFLTCTLAVPTIAVIMGFYPGEITLEGMTPALATGALLGIAHLVLRPILRLLSAPLGCLTLGLFGLVIDVALIYLSASFVPGFVVPGFLYALLTALTINAVCAVAAGRR